MTKQQTILKHALPLLPFDGWSMDTLRHAARDAGLEAGYAEIAFRNGVDEAIELLIEQFDDDMQRIYTQKSKGITSIRQKIRIAVEARLEAMEPYREAVRKTTHYLSLPQHLAFATTLSWKTAGNIWHMIGVNSTDFSYYTRRAILSGVYSSTLLYWLQDESETYKETSEFLSRRIENVMQIMRFRKSVEEKLEKWGC